MTPLNYTDKAIMSLEAGRHVFAADELMPRVMTYLIARLKQAQRFLAPENGFVFGPDIAVDMRKMLRGNARLPFPVMAIEYRHESGVFPVYEGAPYVTLRRLALAIDLVDEEQRKEAVKALFGLDHVLDRQLKGDDGMLIIPIDSLEDPAVFSDGYWTRQMGALDQYWLPAWLAFVAPYAQGRTDDARSEIAADTPPITEDGSGGRPFVGEWYPLPMGRVGYERTKQLLDEGKTLIDASHEYVSEIATTLSVVAALSCRNVGTRLIEPDQKLQRARAKKGKPPLATYHEIVLEAGADRQRAIGAGGESSGRHRASPVEHLRRGHIRHLATGPVWVNFAIVNPGNREAPAKAYRVTAPKS